MDLFEAIDTQRSLRRFSDEPVSDDDIRRMLESARKAPSPTNRQPWAFIVVRDPATRRAMAEIYRKSWGFARQVYGDPEKAEDEPERVMLVETDRLADAIDEAPAFINCMLDKSLLGIMITPDLQTILEPSSVYGAVYAAMQNMMLTARALGLAATPTNLTRFFDNEVRALLGHPEHVETVSLILVGHPLNPRFGPPRRKQLAEIAYSEGWGKALP
jgi:nitroreductase